MDRRRYTHSTTVLALVLLYFPMLPAAARRMSDMNGFVIFPAVIILILLSSGFSPESRTTLGLIPPAGRDWLFLLFLPSVSVSIGLLVPSAGTPLAPEGIPAYLSLAFTAVAAAFAEELFFRSWLIGRYTDLVGRMAIVLVSSALFAAGHLYQGVPVALFAFVMGTLYAVVFLHRGNYWIIAAAHSVHNLLAIPLPDIR